MEELGSTQHASAAGRNDKPSMAIQKEEVSPRHLNVLMKDSHGWGTYKPNISKILCCFSTNWVVVMCYGEKYESLKRYGKEAILVTSCT